MTRRSAALLVVVFCGGIVVSEARPRFARIVETSWGYVEFENNELSVVSTIEDPPKVRLAALYGRSLGAISFNRLRPDGRQEEVALLQGKIDEQFPDRLGGEITLHLRTPDGVGDAAMVPVLTIRSGGVAFHVPVSIGVRQEGG